MSESPTNQTPDKTLTIKVNNTEREIKMTYGLLDEIVGQVKDIDQIGNFFIDQDTRNKVLTAVLSDRTASGKITNKINADDVEIELEDVDAVLAWAASHVTSFFIRSLTNLAARVKQFPMEDQQALAPQSTESSTGSKD